MEKSTRFTIALVISSLIMAGFSVIKVLLLLGYIKWSNHVNYLEILCFVLFIPPFTYMVRDVFSRFKKARHSYKYVSGLNHSLVGMARTESIYDGLIDEVAKELTVKISNMIGVDRCSVWLYSHKRNSIECEKLYLAKSDEFISDIVLSKKDYPEYFESLNSDPIIIANDAASHPSTSCFKDSYLDPLGIKSMLDVPIFFNGKVIGVICSESFTKRDWRECEINYMQNCSSIYSFAYSVYSSGNIREEMDDLENFINESAIVSRTDKRGKITYVNKKFEEISGWKLEEVIGKDHNIVNSGMHSKDFWYDMYKKTVKNKEIWNSIVTNISKDGNLYHVDTYIKAIFDKETGNLSGFMSIRQDLTNIIENRNELEKKNTYLEHAAKILRHDMHSGINTYIPRGISSLERRLNDDSIKELKIEAPLKMIKEGLKHAQKVYRGVYEFTNLVKSGSTLERKDLDLKIILEDYLSSTAYKSQVIISDLGRFEVNEALFCTSIDNLIRNGLRYNDSNTKEIRITRQEDYLMVEDNGRGMSSEDFRRLSQPYVRKEGQVETGSGLGLNICKAILEEHGFSIDSSILSRGGTQIKIKLTR